MINFKGMELKVIEAIQHQLMSSNESDVYLAKNGMKLLMGMQNDNLVDIRGEKNDVNVISTFVSVFAKFKCVNRLAVITCDANLAKQILALNNDTLGGFNILLYLCSYITIYKLSYYALYGRQNN